MTRRPTFLPGLLLAAILATACRSQEPTVMDDRDTSAPFDLAATRRTIEEQNARFTRAHVEGDSATIDAMFTHDATSLPPGAPAVVGVAAIHDLTMEYLKSGVKEFREETTEFYGNADLVIDRGTYVMVYGPDSVTERGKYLNVWRQEGGTWKIHTNIWNADAPPAPAP